MEHYDPSLHPNATRLYGISPGWSVRDVEQLPSIIVTGREIDAVHLRHHPGYIEDGDLNWVEHAWYQDHFNAVAWRLSHKGESGSHYRFYFHNEFDAAEARLLT